MTGPDLVSNGLFLFLLVVSGLVSALDFAETILVDGKTIYVVPAYEFDFSR